ncbi:MAG: hypothetical protein IPL59_26865 [Candidatus Competibacteraceae bacterium]|nr:hypothetical protein [Candidatus Competibacteraceae bacterium]
MARLLVGCSAYQWAGHPGQRRYSSLDAKAGLGRISRLLAAADRSCSPVRFCRKYHARLGEVDQCEDAIIQAADWLRYARSVLRLPKRLRNTVLLARVAYVVGQRRLQRWLAPCMATRRWWYSMNLTPASMAQAEMRGCWKRCGS